MADSEVDTAQQVTSQTPATKPKNPKRVAAGKAIAEKTKQAREEQKKKLAEYEARENDQIKTGPPAVSASEPAAPEPPVDEPSKITTTQWLSVISIIVSLVGDILQTRRDQRPFGPEKAKASGSAAIACFATSSTAIACFDASS